MANQKHVNERFSIVQEVLPAMKLVKYYAWERFFEERVASVRAEEARLNFWNVVIKTVNVTSEWGPPAGAGWDCLPACLLQPAAAAPPPPPGDRPPFPPFPPAVVFGVPPFVLFSVLVPYELTNEANPPTKPYITAPTAFTMLSLFNILRFPLVVLPKAMRCVSEALNATK